MKHYNPLAAFFYSGVLHILHNMVIYRLYMSDKRNQRRGGFYWQGTRPYISVTNILKVIDKPALRYWFGREVFYAMVKNPSMSEAEAMRAPYNKSERAKGRGTTTHSFIEAFKQGMDLDKAISTMPEHIKGYAQAFGKWVTDFKIQPVSQEKTVISNAHGFGGTTDMVTRMDGTNHNWLIDFKTGKAIYDEVELQLSAYKNGLIESGEHVDRLGVVLLETGANDAPTGNYVFKEVSDQFDVFLSAKKLWEWQNQPTLAKVNYYDHYRGGGERK